METKIIPGFLRDIAIGVMGGEQVLAAYIAKREQKPMSNELIRQMFMVRAKELVAKLRTGELGDLCAHGSDWDKSDPAEATLRTDGNNPYSSINLGAYDSGLVLLQKIGVATILVTIMNLIGDIKPYGEVEGWMPYEFFEEDGISWDERQRAEKAITDKLGW